MTEHALQWMHVQACARTHQHMRSNVFAWLWGQSVTQQMAKQWISSSTKNPMVLLDLSSRASPYQPAGNTGVTDILPSRPFCAWQRASRVQRIRSKLCCNLPTGADYHQGDQSFKKRHFRIQMATFESIRKSLLAKTVTKLVPCILNLSVS